MTPLIILVGLLAVPALVLMILRINASLVFLSLCLGSVLVQFVGPDAATMAASLSAQRQGTPPSQFIVNLALLLLPVVLTAVIMIRSIKGHGKLLFNLFPSLGVGALLTLLAIPLLSVGMTSQLTTLPLWHKLESFETLIISANTILALLFLWMQRPKPSHEEHAK